jgi:hypothetical protein
VATGGHVQSRSPDEKVVDPLSFLSGSKVDFTLFTSAIHCHSIFFFHPSTFASADLR